MIFIPYGTREQSPRRRFPVITLLLVTLNVAVFALQIAILSGSGESGLAQFIQQFAVIPASVTDTTPGEIGLVTSMFLHGGLLHIAGNMMYLLPFGDNVEDRLGWWRYLLFYLLCGLVATLSFVVLNPASTTPLLGASGAIAGVLGGYLALHHRGRVKGLLFIVIVLMRIELPAIIFIGYWFFMQVFSSIASLGADSQQTGGVAFVAHVGGFIAGLILAPLFALTARRKHDTTLSY